MDTRNGFLIDEIIDGIHISILEVVLGKMSNLLNLLPLLVFRRDIVSLEFEIIPPAHLSVA